MWGELLEARQLGEKWEAECGWNEKLRKGKRLLGAVDFFSREVEVSVGGKGTSVECVGLLGRGITSGS